MIEVLGREFSTQTISVRRYLEKNDLPYRFIDIDFDEKALEWIKFNKIMGLPVIKFNSYFAVGSNSTAIDQLIALSRKNGDKK